MQICGLSATLFLVENQTIISCGRNIFIANFFIAVFKSNETTYMRFVLNIYRTVTHTQTYTSCSEPSILTNACVRKKSSCQNSWKRQSSKTPSRQQTLTRVAILKKRREKKTLYSSSAFVFIFSK